MRIPIYATVLALAGLASSCTSPAPERWYKGNLHTHTYWSDGDEFPEMVLDWYKQNGYDFIALSDHNTIANEEKWKLIVNSPLYEQSFKNYLDRFGEEWVEYKRDTGRIQVRLKTYEEYRSKLESGKFLVIRAEEITNSVNQMPVHVNATNLREFIPPPGGATVLEAMQQSVDAVLQQRERTGVPMFPHINHPNFVWAITVDDMINLKGERFFEVYNGHPLVNNYGDTLRPGTEAMWDQINLQYVNRNQPVLYGLATDDSHNYHQFGSAFSNAGRGWVVVQARELTADALIGAMEEGKFYASTGVVLKSLLQNQREIRLEVLPEEGVNYRIEFIGVRQNETQSSVLQTIQGTKARFTLSPDYLFVRARVISDKSKANPFQDKDVEMAWTQPVVPK